MADMAGKPGVTAVTAVSGDDAVDLQLHTVYSDGTWRPADLFDELAARRFRVVAITDHDTLDHTEELIALGAARGVTVIPAVEVTTRWGEYWADLLCFAPISTGFTGDALRSLVSRTTRLQIENTRAVHEELLRRGYAFPRQAEVLAAHAGALHRPSDNVDLLVRHGYAGDFYQALDMLRDAGFRSIYASLEEAVAAAHASGALAILAHPGRQDVEISRFDPPLLAELLQAIPLDGIEVLYPLHTSEQVAAYTAFVEDRSLLRSAGSDSHGPRHRLPIPYPAASSAALLARCGIQVSGQQIGGR
jgi:predicted metal-dependent phosphoesterase TrpH